MAGLSPLVSLQCNTSTAFCNHSGTDIAFEKQEEDLFRDVSRMSLKTVSVGRAPCPRWQLEYPQASTRGLNVRLSLPRQPCQRTGAPNLSPLPLLCPPYLGFGWRAGPNHLSLPGQVGEAACSKGCVGRETPPRSASNTGTGWGLVSPSSDVYLARRGDAAPAGKPGRARGNHLGTARIRHPTKARCRPGKSPELGGEADFHLRLHTQGA